MKTTECTRCHSERLVCDSTIGREFNVERCLISTPTASVMELTRCLDCGYLDMTLRQSVRAQKPHPALAEEQPLERIAL